MNPVRRNRLLLILALLTAAAVAVALVTLALQQNLTYLYTPGQVHTGEAPDGSRFRLGGEVCTNSFERTEGTLKVRFDVTDRERSLPVRYEGILPDLFREGQSIIATGSMVDDTFVADQILAKHDETYMPKEVADAMAQAMSKPEGSGCPQPPTNPVAAQ
ncbi:MAG: cytochrome c maturation protein CcmE [Gammaproteobacteria bacterium HGW-Gammaproteobacteria-7]|nr:MAG: cytochrome c maturation protein CcmE [Gammaproteobacteria bacterium HGW-Gammaproteobacteria-7]